MKPVMEPDWDTFTQWPGQGVILAFDQSLSASGWSLVSFTPGARPTLLNRGTVVTKPLPGLSGLADSFARGDALFEMFRAILRSTEFNAVVHERPYMEGIGRRGGGKAKRSGVTNREAPFISATSLRNAIAVERPGVRVAMVDATRAKTCVAGDRFATKPQVRAGVMAALGLGSWSSNEHVADSVALAITSVLDGALDKEGE